MSRVLKYAHINLILDEKIERMQSHNVHGNLQGRDLTDFHKITNENMQKFGNISWPKAGTLFITPQMHKVNTTSSYSHTQNTMTAHS